MTDRTEEDSTVQNSGLSFTAPTEMVDLPSGGRFYPDGHPLHGVETVEIKYMTAKEEDILTNKALLKKGVALDRLLESVIVNPKVSPKDLLVGDKNALLVAARVTGYGSDYETTVTCPACDERSQYTFDLDSATVVKGGDTQDAHANDKGNWDIKLPLSGLNVEVRLLFGLDEKRLTDSLQEKRRMKLPENAVTEQLKMVIVSVNGESNPAQVAAAIEFIPARDARFLRAEYAKLAPGIDLTQNFVCEHCDTETVMEVPFSTDFFWTRR